MNRKNTRWILWAVTAVVVIVVLAMTLFLWPRENPPAEDTELSYVPTVTPVHHSTPAPTQPPVETPSAEPSPTGDMVEELYRSMTLEQRVGQLFFARFSGAQAAGEIERYAPAGYILFAVDFKDQTPESLRGELKSLQSKSNTPLLFGVDEEGGTVVRASKYAAFRKVPFSSPQKVYVQGGMDALRADAREKSQFLLSLGLNVNLAPVCDVSTDPSDFIYLRAFGRGGEETAEYVGAVVEEMGIAGIGAVLKHFPGYGDNVDTHTGIAVDERPLSTFEAQDFLPFQAGFKAGAGGVLVSHNIVKCMDEDLPASLSAEVHRVLREDLEYTGVIMTDDLAMDAVQEYGDGNAAVLAVQAGNDLLISSDLAAQYGAVLQAVKAGTISQDRLESAVKNVLRWKQELGLLG